MQKKKKRKKTNKRKFNHQKTFSFISFIFILTCFFWYGGRAIYFYLGSKKIVENEDNVLAMKIRNNNKNGNFKLIGTDHYFINNVDNNYVMYSNMLWRVIKVTKDNNVVLILDDTITNLSFGKGKKYSNTYLIKWLNKDGSDYTGILEKNLNDANKYLVKTKTCIDNITNIKKITCDKVNDDNYLSLLSINDYVNTGSNNSFINDKKYYYLANNSKSKVWYVDDNGKLDTNSGEDVYGVRPVITLKKDLKSSSGDGTINSPYKFETSNSIFASYVKLGEDVWRVYSEDDKYIKLVLNDYLKVDDEKFEYNYSKTDYKHDDTVYGTLAYYLNNKYLYGLSYKDLIIEAKYSNGYYGEDNNYDYSDNVSTTIDTKVGLLSIGDAIVNNSFSDYFILTGPSKESEEVYVMSKNSTIDTVYAINESYIIPTITIEKSNLKNGNGTSDDPYRTE